MGWNVPLRASGQEGLESAERDVEAAGDRGLVLPLDIADADAMPSA